MKRMPLTGTAMVVRCGHRRPATAERLRQRVSHLSWRSCAGSDSSAGAGLVPLAVGVLALVGTLAAALLVACSAASAAPGMPRGEERRTLTKPVRP